MDQAAHPIIAALCANARNTPEGVLFPDDAVDVAARDLGALPLDEKARCLHELVAVAVRFDRLAPGACEAALLSIERLAKDLAQVLKAANPDDAGAAQRLVGGERAIPRAPIAAGERNSPVLARLGQLVDKKETR